MIDFEATVSSVRPKFALYTLCNALNETPTQRKRKKKKSLLPLLFRLRLSILFCLPCEYGAMTNTASPFHAEKVKQRTQHLNRQIPSSDELVLLYAMPHSLFSQKKHCVAGNRHYFSSPPFAKLGAGHISAQTKSKITHQYPLSFCFCLLKYNSPLCIVLG